MRALKWIRILAVTMIIGYLGLAGSAYGAGPLRLEDGTKVELKDGKLYLMDESGRMSPVTKGTHRLKSGGTITTNAQGLVTDSRLSAEEASRLAERSAGEPTQSTGEAGKVYLGGKPAKKGSAPDSEKKTVYKGSLLEGRKFKVVVNKMKLQDEKDKWTVAKQGAYVLATGKQIETNKRGKVLWEGKVVDRITEDGTVIVDGKRVGTLKASIPKVTPQGPAEKPGERKPPQRMKGPKEEAETPPEKAKAEEKEEKPPTSMKQGQGATPSGEKQEDVKEKDEPKQGMRSTSQGKTTPASQ